jgi:hypothetical protein
MRSSATVSIQKKVIDLHLDDDQEMISNSKKRPLMQTMMRVDVFKQNQLYM